MSESSQQWDPVIYDVEQWFVKRGMPHAIADYRATTDVFTRMLPFLVLINLLGTLGVFGDRFEGVAQFVVAIAAIALLVAGWALVNRLRGRPLFTLPDTVGILEVSFWLGFAPLLGLIFGDANQKLLTAIIALLSNLLLLAVGYLVTSFGLLHMVRWGAKQMLRELTGLATLLARTLPLLLLFATFLFINAEMWQVAHEISAPFYAIVVGTLLLAGIGFLALRLPTEMKSLQRFSSWKDVSEVAEACYPPSSGLHIRGERPKRVPLGFGERSNLLLLMLTAKVVQMVLVGMIIGAFYVLFGMLTVREETFLQWTSADQAMLATERLAKFSLFGSDIIVTWELLAVSGFIAAISALQFAVSLLTDDTYRAEFNADIEIEVREIMAVRALYLSHVRSPLAAEAEAA